MTPDVTYGSLGHERLVATPLLHSSELRCRRARRAAALTALAVGLPLAGAAAPAQATTKAFTYTGAEQTFTVPGGVHSVHVLAIGGAGGASNDANGGFAAEVVGDVSATPGQTLYIEVGGNGQGSGEGGAGGFNGGAAGGGGGGGASDVRTSPRSGGLSPDDRLIVSGGGGGGGDGTAEEVGGAGGAAGSPGAATSYSGGGAGTQTEGGSGASGCEPSGQGENGQLGSGGAGGNSAVESGPGGGGGGGYYGGAGGGGSCFVGSSGGGGGSSLVPAGGSFAVTGADTPAKVEVTYTLVPPTIAVIAPVASATYIKGQAVTAIYSCTPPEGTGVKTCAGTVVNGAALDTSTVGPHAFTVEAEDTDGAMETKEVSYTVVVPPSIAIVTPTNGATYTQGQAVTAVYSCTPGEGTGLKTCSGAVPNGATIDTSVLGLHTFTVNAEDSDGGRATKEVTYTVVGAPAPSVPDTILGSHPKGKVKAKKKIKVSFSFSSPTAGATFECKLDKGAFAPCASPKSYKVKPGKHTFSVEAVSSGGTDPTPATFSFRVKKKR